MGQRATFPGSEGDPSDFARSMLEPERCVRELSQLLDAGISSVVVATVVWLLRQRIGAGRWLRWSVIGVAAAYFGLILLRAAQAVVDPPAWDFPVFYTVARAASAGADFYDPDVLRATFAPLAAAVPLSSRWLEVSPGWWYPPPTALYLAPLGFLGYRVALVLHTALQLLLLVGAAVALRRVVNWPTTALGTWASALLILAFDPVRQTVVFGQVSFAALFCIALAMRSRSAWAGGAWLGLGAVFKPVALVASGLQALERGWRWLGGAVAILVTTTVVALAVFGRDVIGGFIGRGPESRPAALAMDPVIQSLLGVLRRFLGDTPTSPGALAAVAHLPYVVVGTTMVATAVVLVRRRSKLDADLSFSFLLVTALIIYPNTLTNTIALMLPAIFVFVDRSKGLWPVGAAASVVGGVYFLAGIQSINGGFWSMVVLWIALAATLRRDQEPSPPTREIRLSGGRDSDSASRGPSGRHLDLDGNE